MQVYGQHKSHHSASKAQYCSSRSPNIRFRSTFLHPIRPRRKTVSHNRNGELSFPPSRYRPGNRNSTVARGEFSPLETNAITPKLQQRAVFRENAVYRLT